MADTHMSISIKDSLLSKDAVGRDKVLDERRIDEAARRRRRLCESGRLFDPGSEK